MDAVRNRIAGFSWEPYLHLAEVFGTPLYLFHPERALWAFDRLKSGLAKWGRGRVAYSVKTNPLPRLLGLFEKRGALAEVVSGWEYRHARAMGFPAQRIVFGGPCKSRDSLLEAVQEGVLTINVDSLDELELIRELVPHVERPVNVGLRLCHDLDTGAPSRFGLELASGEFQEGLALIRSTPGLRLRSLHVHLGTQMEDSAPYRETCAQMAALWKALRIEPHVILDLGGGYPFQHHIPFDEQPFDLVGFFTALRESWRGSPRPELMVEPGRYLAAGCMSVLSKVIAHKTRSAGPDVVVIDSGTNHSALSACHEHLWRFQTAQERKGSFRFYGPLCMEEDTLSGEMHGGLPAVGSHVLMENAGAYSLSFSRTFIQPRPPIVSYTPGTAAEQLTQRESLASAYGLVPLREPLRFPQSCQSMLKTDSREADIPRRFTP